MPAAHADDIAEVLGERADEAIIDRIVSVGATLDEVVEALDDVDYEARFGEPRDASSPKIEELRNILEELPHREELMPAGNHEEDVHEGLTVIEAEELGLEPP